MNKLRDCAIVLGLVGTLLMVSADTKDVLAAKSAESLGMQKGFLLKEEIIENISEERKEETKEEIIEESTEENTTEEEAVLLQETEVEEEAEAVPERQIELEDSDYSALLRIVEAEASGEDMKGKMLVANVVLNRVDSPTFPDTVEAVVYQRAGGKAQFSPVATGKIERVTVSEETVEAVERVLCGEDESEGALYFIAKSHAESGNVRWFERNLTKLFTYRGHEFYT